MNMNFDKKERLCWKKYVRKYISSTPLTTNTPDTVESVTCVINLINGMENGTHQHQLDLELSSLPLVSGVNSFPPRFAPSSLSTNQHIIFRIHSQLKNLTHYSHHVTFLSSSQHSQSHASTSTLSVPFMCSLFKSITVILFLHPYLI